MQSSAPLLTRAQLAAVIVAVLAVIATIAAAIVVLPPAFRAAGPDLPVRAYLQAIEKGDISKALVLGRISVGADDKLLTNAAYQQASDRVTSFAVLGVTLDGSSGTVGVRISQGDRSYVSDFDVTRASGPSWFAPWRLTRQKLPQIKISLAAPIDRTVKIAGVTFNLKGGAVTQQVFPAAYEATDAMLDQENFSGMAADAETTFATVTPAAAVMQFSLAPNGGLTAETQVSQWITACATSTDLAPAGCPFRAVPEPSITYSDGQWSIQTQPRVDVGEWNAQLGGWSVTTSALGYVSFTARAQEGELVGTATTGSNPFSVAGTVVPDAKGGLHFVPSPAYASPSAAGSLT